MTATCQTLLPTVKEPSFLPPERSQSKRKTNSNYTVMTRPGKDEGEWLEEAPNSVCRVRKLLRVPLLQQKTEAQYVLDNERLCPYRSKPATSHTSYTAPSLCVLKALWQIFFCKLCNRKFPLPILHCKTAYPNCKQLPALTTVPQIGSFSFFKKIE